MEHKRFTNTDIGISGVVPAGWVQAQPGVWLPSPREAKWNLNMRSKPTP
jgi:hypothetical protein